MLASLKPYPSEPACRYIVFRPLPNGTIMWTETELGTLKVKVRVLRHKGRAGLKLNLTVPSGAEATRNLPEGCGMEQPLRPEHDWLTLARKGK